VHNNLLIFCRGEEFRPALDLVCIFDKAFHLLLTATATPKSIETLTKQMNLKNPVVISENVDRPNIFLGVKESTNLKSTIT
jgi:superfamily II DNA helicase RecQ